MAIGLHFTENVKDGEWDDFGGAPRLRRVKDVAAGAELLNCPGGGKIRRLAKVDFLYIRSRMLLCLLKVDWTCFDML